MKENLESLAADQVAWQRRVEALEASRVEIHARLMALQQESMESEIDPQALEAAKRELKDVDLKLEAAAAKLKSLFGSLLRAAEAENEARYRAAPETQDALDQEYQAKCEQAAAHLVQVVDLLEDLAIHPQNLVKIIGLDTGIGDSPFAGGNEVLSEAYGQAKRPPLSPRDSEWAATYRQRQNDLHIFLSSWAFNRISVNHQTVNRAIRAAGGQPPAPKPYYGEREAAYVGKDF